MLGVAVFYSTRVADWPPGDPGAGGRCGTLVSPQGPCQGLRDRLPVAAAVAGSGLGLITSAVLLNYARSSFTWRLRPSLARAGSIAVGVVVAIMMGLLIYGVLLSEINLDRN